MPVIDRRWRRRIGSRFSALPFLGPRAAAIHLRRKYGARVVTPAKVQNFIRGQQERLSRALEVQSLPWILNLDTFSGCNLGCRFCPTGTDQLERPKARMPVDRAKRVIDLVKDHVLEIRLYNWGEPFLNPDIFEITRHAHDAGLFTVINSNLSVSVPGLARKIVDSGLDRLQASVDGVAPTTLERYRRRASAELVFANVRAIADERARRGVAHPSIELMFLVFCHNEHEIGQLEAKRRAVGADAFQPRRAFIYHESFVPKHPAFPPLQTIFQGTCDFLYAELTVEANGAISPCCTSMSERWDLGTIQELKELREFWNSPTHRAMRAFASGKRNAESIAPKRELLCQTCDIVAHRNFTPSSLSPLPPSFQATGVTYAHRIDSLEARQLG
jgi:radical SAM protein with 4Fe4S-binding SPASM domain